MQELNYEAACLAGTDGDCFAGAVGGLSGRRVTLLPSYLKVWVFASPSL